MTLNRLSGGLIDRGSVQRFTFDGRAYEGFSGDTLASALLANGVRLVGRSFKYHRPRGILASGSDEPNALVTLGKGARTEPNTRATTVELFDGLFAESQNRWPTPQFDALAINDWLHPFLTAGFYYKTFMWPGVFWEKIYEPAIRRAAGLGRLSGLDDPDIYDKGYLECDLLVVGSGAAGLAASLVAGRSGARVVLADEDFRFGGRLLAENGLLEGQTGTQWIDEVTSELAGLHNVRLMPRTAVVGAYDHGVYGALERVADHSACPREGEPRQTFWRIRANQTLICTGALERPIAFQNNDRPGIMLAGAMRSFVNRWAATPSRRIAVFCNNDDAHRTVTDLVAKGIEIPVVVDIRPDAPDIAGTELLRGAVVEDTAGRLGLRSITVRMANGETRRIECGALAVSGGWSPNLALTSHQGARPEWDAAASAFRPASALPPGQHVAGAVCGCSSTAAALADGVAKAQTVLSNLGIKAATVVLPAAIEESGSSLAFWHVPHAKRAWVDFQNDVTVKDIQLANREGFNSVEHLKRYTTLGMGTDQGKVSNVVGLAILAEISGRTIPETGTTLFRPPYVPVPVGALAGRSTGKEFRPTRLPPSHDWAVEQGAVFVEAGNWLRAQWFPRPGETHWRETVDREVLATRSSVGICDVSTLGKIDVQGKDAALFLDRVYANTMSTLAVGRVRYGLMLREDGMVFDDGTAARFASDHFVVTTTTVNAGAVYRHMEFALQCLWPGLDVQLVSTTENWAQFSVAGPKSRTLLERIVDTDFDISNAAFPFMACAHLTVCGGLNARLFRISFSGELAYEIAVPAPYGDALIRRLMDVGGDLGIVAYGTEALGVMRIEKGHVAGGELNGTTTALNLGIDRLISRKKDCIGRVMARREGLVEPDGLRLVGLRSVSAATIPAGAHLMAAEGPVDAAHGQGYVTSSAWSPVLGASIALALLKAGTERTGERLRAVSPVDDLTVDVDVVSPHFVDPEGARLRD